MHGGALWLLRQVKMIPMVSAFLATFFALIGLFAVFGRSYIATWHDGPVGGSFYRWLALVGSNRTHQRQRFIIMPLVGCCP